MKIKIMKQSNFGLGQFKNETPIWAKNAFRITALLTFVATFIVATDQEIPKDLAVRIAVYLKALDLLVFGLSKMFGIKIEEDKSE